VIIVFFIFGYLPTVHSVMRDAKKGWGGEGRSLGLSRARRWRRGGPCKRQFRAGFNSWIFTYSAPSVRSEEPLFPTYDVPRPVRLTSHYEVPPSPLPLHPSPATRQYKLLVTNHIQCACFIWLRSKVPLFKNCFIDNKQGLLARI
jgi:hypothetical protein